MLLGCAQTHSTREYGTLFLCFLLQNFMSRDPIGSHKACSVVWQVVQVFWGKGQDAKCSHRVAFGPLKHAHEVMGLLDWQRVDTCDLGAHLGLI